MLTSLSLIDPSYETASVEGQPFPAAGWYGPTSGLHTVSIRVLNFQGRITIQASLAAAPTESDWYSVMPNGAPYWQYPFTNTVVDNPYTGETSMRGFSFSTNALWVRAVIDRSYLGTSFFSPQQIGYLGTVDSILLNY